jgi:hypothetical protein
MDTQERMMVAHRVMADRLADAHREQLIRSARARGTAPVTFTGRTPSIAELVGAIGAAFHGLRHSAAPPKVPGARGI